MSFDDASKRILKHVVVESAHRHVGRSAEQPHTLHLDKDLNTEKIAQQKARQIVQQATQEAEALLEKTRQQASQLLAESEDKIKTLEKNAEARGFEQGQANAEQKLKASLQQVQSVIEGAHLDRQNLLTGVEQEVVHLVLEITRRILKIEPLINEQVLIRVASEALSHLGQQLEVIIEVHPEDVELLHFSLSQLEDLALDILIEPHADISIGSCRIRSKAGKIDANLNTQFNAIAQSFLALAEGEPL